MSESGRGDPGRSLRLFEQCLDLPLEEREPFLRERCGDDEPLLAEVRLLLDLEEKESGEGLRPLVSLPDPVDFLADDASGERIGAYELGQRIGAGGMGEVFRARRVDGTFDRTVAVKRIRPGAATGEVLSRFHRERRVLAALEHRNIARLLDAGADDDGVPYLVMEFVDGVPIDRYCDEQRLPVEQRVRLFLKVCDAVDHAHRIGVTHRDLKPPNILVTEDGEPKLLDFGLAGVLRPDTLGQDLTLTVDALGYMTPAYASPEQLTRAPLHAASDQYSLAVVLYELLTGLLPHDLESLSPAEMERVVSEELPASPSNAVGTTSVERMSPVAQARRVGVPALRRALRGDLDRILLMALRAEPERRYASVHDLAEDLRNYLAGHPVRARRDSMLYRTSRFVRRNRLAVGLTAVVITTISAALVIALDALRETELAREQAEGDRTVARDAQSDAEAITTFLTEMLASGEPWAMGKDVQVREVLDRSAAEVEDRFGTRPLIAARIHLTIGRSYTRLGVLEPALEHAERALELFEQHLPETDPRIRDAIWVLGLLHKTAERNRLSFEFFSRAHRLTREALGDDRVDAYKILNDVAGALRADARFDEAEPLFFEALAGITRVAGEDARDNCEPLNNLGLIHMLTGRLDEARPFLLRSLDLTRTHYGPDHPQTLIVRHNLGHLLFLEKRLDEADSALTEVLDLFLEKVGEAHPNALMTRTILARCRWARGQRREAIEMAESILVRHREVRGSRDLVVADELMRVAEFHGRIGNLAVTEELTYEAMVLHEALLLSSDPRRPRSVRAHSVTLHRQGDRQGSTRDLTESLRLLEGSTVTDDRAIAAAHWQLAISRHKSGEFAGSAYHLSRWLELRPEDRIRGTRDGLLALHNLGSRLILAREFPAAEPYLLESYTRHCDAYGQDHEKLISPAQSLEALYHRWNRPEQQAVWTERVRELKDGAER